VARGLSNKQLAATLELDDKTIEYHATQLLRRAGTGNRAQLTALLFSL
jgi:DNA-binding NarL/FixJ family response regulator